MRILLLLVLLSSAGCMRYIISEPLPAVLQETVSLNSLPDGVIAAFVRAHQRAVITKIVAYTFKGKVVRYEFSFRDATGLHKLNLRRDGEILGEPTDVSQ